MAKWQIFFAGLMAFLLLLACSPAAPTPASPPSQGPTTLPPELTKTPASLTAHLTPNPIEDSKPVYGGTLIYGFGIPRTFDAHQKVSYGPMATLPVFNQLVMYDNNYKETVAESIIGDLAESWETSQDGKEITFKVHRGVKWQDGVSFTADDVIFSLDKMADVNRSVIADWFPAYQSTEKIDDYTVKVHLKYPSAGFMLSLAQGESQIQPLHLSGTDDQSAEFMVGTGPFILEEYLPGVHLKYKRNPDYWKKDKNGNQMPYMDGLFYLHTVNDDMVISRRIDIRSLVSGAATLSTYNYLKQGAPEILWQRRDKSGGNLIFLNTKHPPLDDIRVRRAMGLVLNEENLIIGYSGDVMFGLPGSGILPPAWGLPKEEVTKLMGWDKPYEERVAEAQRLMTEAGYPNGFKLNMMSSGVGSTAAAGATLVYADTLKKYLKIDAEVSAGLGVIELEKRAKEGDYDTYTYFLPSSDPLQLATYFRTGGFANHANYSNPDMDKIMDELDHILDSNKREEAVWSIERTLLTDLPALPTGTFTPTLMPYYPYVKNLRWNYISYSNVNRLEDVWLDESLR